MGAIALRSRPETSEVPVAVCVGRAHQCDEYDGRTGPERPHIRVHLDHDQVTEAMVWLWCEPFFLSGDGQARVHDLITHYREKRWIRRRALATVTNRGCAIDVRVSAVMQIVPDLQEVVREHLQVHEPPDPAPPETSATRLRRWADSIR